MGERLGMNAGQFIETGRWLSRFKLFGKYLPVWR
ncbi:MAG: hypothetical protein JWQ54_1357 [Mucilaginibacter sp.]|nr:hypothetical protein [Mucilaginibacter sp.]